MKPAPFDYQAPATLDAALDLLARHGGDAKILAGGQSLIPVMNFRLAEPALLIDINKIAELDFVRRDADGTLRIGALARHRQLEREPLVAAAAPLLHEAVPHIAHPQIRNRGTFGGSLAHADPAAELPAVALALDARLRLRRAGGDRWVEARERAGETLFSTSQEAEDMLAEGKLPPKSVVVRLTGQDLMQRGGEQFHRGPLRAGRAAALQIADGPDADRRAGRELLLGQLRAQAVAAQHGVESRTPLVRPVIGRHGIEPRQTR